MAGKIVITAPVVDLRQKPVHLAQTDYSHQDYRESQLLFGERGAILQEEGEWLEIAALEQSCFDEKRGWHPYIGWVHQSEVKRVGAFEETPFVVCSPTLYLGDLSLSYGTLLPEAIPGKTRPLPKKPNREYVVEEAKTFLGSPYLWGGRSFPLKQAISSVDCSGLINLLYRAQGINLPRNAHEQYLMSSPIRELQPADPLYLAKEKRISHVILKLDETTFIESPQTGKCVRLLHWGEEIWEEGGKIRIFDRPNSYNAYPSTFFA